MDLLDGDHCFPALTVGIDRLSGRDKTSAIELEISDRIEHVAAAAQTRLIVDSDDEGFALLDTLLDTDIRLAVVAQSCLASVHDDDGVVVVDPHTF